MKYSTIIKKKFKFLKTHGFKMKKYTNGVDVEIYYEDRDKVIEIYHTLCVGDLEFGHLNTDDLLKTAYYAVDIIINKNHVRKNIFDWKELFGDAELLMLKRNIEEVTSDDEKIGIFANFVEKNIGKIIE